jgi:hypothetical protein
MANEKIIPASQKLLFEILRDLPLSPVHMNLSMVADDILYPFCNAYSVSEVQTYLDKCKNGKIIPCSRANFEYIEQSIYGEGLFVPKIELAGIDHWPEEKRQEAIKSWINGGKIHRINYILDDFSQNNKGFANFREKHLETAINNGYHLRNMELWLRAQHRGGYNEGYYCRSSIETREGNVEFSFDNLSEFAKKDADSFFLKLSDKYKASVHSEAL